MHPKLLPVLLALLLCACQSAYARHGKGGSLTYVYLGAGTAANTSKYKVTIEHYINCERISDESSGTYLGIFEGSAYSLVNTVSLTQTTRTLIQKQSFNPCINPAPAVCFYLVTYVTTVELADNTAGYVLTEQECCRADGIVNLSNGGTTGFTNFNTIPGIINGVVYRNNSNPTLVFKDTAVICHNSYFRIDFSAVDPDGDVLSYSLCSAKATSSTSRQPNPPAAPPYADVTYQSGYSGGSPMGSGVTIDAVTGILSGTAPATTGPYIVSVCITETRGGVVISVTKKEVMVTVADCSLSAATLNTSYINCDNFTFTFQNESSSSSVSSYAWDFGVPGITTDVSIQATPTYTYPDTGTYVLKLKVSNTSGCLDSTTAPVKVYPGFTPDFSVSGSCYQSPFTFTDLTVAKYGYVSSWSWNFGEAAAAANTSTDQNPVHQYASPAVYTVVLDVASSKGCSSTVSKTVTANDKPTLYLPFKDTLICSIDSLPLIAQGSATAYSWSPNYNIINANTANPIVFPKDTTVYTVTATDKGCTAVDSITVNVLDYITVSLIADTTICRTDSIRLNPVSYALRYQWSPATGLSDATAKNPLAAPLSDITYQVLANLGKCQDKASIHINVVPYPQADAGADTTICYGGSAQLNGAIVASSFAWTPIGTLANTKTLYPIASPLQNTYYVLAVADTLGCPKIVRDTVDVSVIPKIIVFAGNDTAVVVGQPLQLSATSSDTTVTWSWSPLTWLGNATISNPVVTIYSTSVDSITYLLKATTPLGCYGTDDIKITVYKTKPDIFMPGAFTPNGDGRNDVFKPILVGITKLDFFKVFNRWGQLVYATAQNGSGWDGTLGGKQEGTGTFVYIVQGRDYLGNTITKKGTFILVR